MVRCAQVERTTDSACRDRGGADRWHRNCRLVGLFVMQVNVERLPFGLFRRLSSHPRLLLSFASSFVLAIAVAAFSLITSPANAGFFVGAAVLSILLILRSFLFAYRRSLTLISPEYQLELIVAEVVASAECCRDYEREKLRKQALWLVSAFSWLPTERDAALHVQDMSFIDHLLEIALAAHRWDDAHVLDEIRKRMPSVPGILLHLLSGDTNFRILARSGETSSPILVPDSRI